MKKFILFFLLINFQIAYAENEAKQLETIISSLNNSSKNENLRTIVNYLNYANNVDFNSILNLKENKENKIYLEFAKGYFLYLKSDFENASSFLYKIYLPIYETDNYDDQYVLYHYLYDIEKTLGNDSNSLFFLNKINSIYLKTKNINYLYFYLIEKGVCYRNTKQYEKAIELFKEAEKISKKVQNKTPFNWLYLHQGRTYLEMGDYLKAKYYYDLCKNNIEKSNFNILYILYEFFLIDYYKKDYNNALIKANQMIEIASNNNNIDAYMLVPLYNKIGEIYIYSDQKKGIYFFEKALNEGLKTKQHEGVYDACLQLLKHKNISKTAQKNIMLFLTHIKESENREVITKINSSERLNSILNYESEIKEQKKYIAYYLILIFFSFLLITILMLFYVNQKKSLFVINTQKEELSKQNRVLSKYNAEINIEYGKIETLNNTLAHDIKSGIISINEIAKKITLITTESKINIASNKIIDEADNLKETVDFLLENAKNNYNTSLEAEEIDWNNILKQAKNSLEHLILLTHPSISINGNLPSFMGYKTHFYQLFKNLIENSLKYNNPSNPCIISIKISKDKNKKLKIQYEDNGIGIEQENLDKIFEFFNQSKFEHNYKGYGIGLGICKKIVDTYNGKISVDSKPQCGTKFTIIMNELIY